MSHGSNGKEKKGVDAPMTAQGLGPSEEWTIRKRSARACARCSRLKMRCINAGKDDDEACQRCIRQKQPCVYSGGGINSSSSSSRQSLSLSREKGGMATTKRLKRRNENVLHSHRSSRPTFSSSSSSSSSSGCASSTCELIRRGILSQHDIAVLYDFFIARCLPHIGLLDPEWHTLSRIAARSEFLLSTICLVSACLHSDNSSSYRIDAMFHLVEEMMGSLLVSGQQSVDVVQAFVLLYLWSPAMPACDDPRLAQETAWTFSGIAIRMAAGLDLYRFANLQEKQGEEAEELNRQRTGMLTLAIDRTVSIAYGKPFTVEMKHVSREKLEAWHETTYHQSWDMGVSAVVSLLETTCHWLSRLTSSTTTNPSEMEMDAELRRLKLGLLRWQVRWASKGLFSAAGAAAGPSAQSGGSSTTEQPLQDRLKQRLPSQATLRLSHATLFLQSYCLRLFDDKGAEEITAEESLCEKYEECILESYRAAITILHLAEEDLRASLAHLPHTQIAIISYACLSLYRLACRPLIGTIVNVDPLAMVKRVHECADLLARSSIQPWHPAGQHARIIGGYAMQHQQQQQQQQLPLAHLMPTQSNDDVTKGTTSTMEGQTSCTTTAAAKETEFDNSSLADALNLTTEAQAAADVFLAQLLHLDP